ncbi:zinc finger C3H1 domain-containing protein [Trematomus bernacchii]|uniref:zinc finger C3H1 domain-containing protein n=1 Tax=Trematomus bernacchii TaxID=40690 RepID=UPI00146D6828|nr:zinc finger C3H1 domain-containing protein [Trematomus bernacchii]
MLLRETCLMSMAHKRVTATEEKSSSAPPSPGCSSPADLQQPIRSSLSTVSLTRSNKFSRGARAPLVLPRHKAVVVSLRDSEDSDSDSGSQPAFGGLEFMIKEARRTVEAAKPKAASGSEKENNPGRTPEALPEAQRAEYRLLKEQIASREKQKLLKDLGAPPRGPSSPPVPDALQEASVRAAAERRLGEAEQRLSRHRELQQRDEAVLRHLLQQEQKKRESLKAAEGKVLRVREQLQAAEKVVTANRTLLKKLQEQVQRVEQRVSLKQTVCERLQLQLSAAQQAAGGGAKRRADTIHSQPMKQRRLDPALRTAGGHFAELLAQKQRLQLLEREYALKIQQLKDRQALRSNPPVSELPPVSNLTLPTPSPSTLPLSQPSLHDLTQDKLILDSEEEAEDPQVSVSLGEGGPVSASVREGGRRPSLCRSSSSFTRPHLEQQGSPKDNNKPLPLVPPPRTEVLGGLPLEALQQGGGPGGLGELLQREMLLLGGGVHSPSPTAQVVSVEIDAATSQSGSGDLKPVPYTAYHSPLLVFRSYRFSPYFRTKEKLPLSSVTYSNCMDPRRNFCRFELSGTCNDDLCRWQHMRDCTLTGNQLLQDFLSYNLSLIGCSETSSDKDISACTERYMQQLFGSNSVRMSLDQKAVLLVSKVNESRRHVPPFTTCKDPRSWRPSAQSSAPPQEDSEDESAGGETPEGGEARYPGGVSLDVCVSSEDKRYFLSETDDLSNLELSVLQSPRDTQLWIKLAFKYLQQSEACAAEGLEAALNTLSRALESNCGDPEVWSHYLSLFSRRGSRDELQQMCEMAVEHAPHYRVWWEYLQLEGSFEGKDFVCERLLQFLLMEAPPSSSQLMEAPPSSSQLMEAPPSSSQLMEAPPSSSQLMEAPPCSSQLMEAPPSSDRGSSPSSDRESSQLMEAPPSSDRGSSPSSDRESSQLMEAPPSSDRGSSPSSDRDSSQLMEAPPSYDRGSSPSSDRDSSQLMEAPPSSDRGSSPSSDRGSFQLMEALLYRVQLHLFSGRGGSALALLQGALKAPQLRSLLDHLSPSHRALLWLCFVHLTEFSRLPSLFLPAESGPGRLVSTESFLMPWRTPRDIRTPTHTLIQLFQDGVLQCCDERLSVSERTLACLPLHNNLLFLYRLLERYDEGVALCESLLQVCPDSAPLRVSLSELLLLRGDTEGGVNTWLTALTESPHNAELLYRCCCFLRAQERCSAIAPLVRCFMLSLCEEQQSVREPVDVLRQLLGFPSEELQRAPIITDLQEPLRQQRAYLHLIHCCWQRLHGSVDDTVDAYERALGSVLQRDQLHTLWMEYLEFSSVSLSRSKRFSNLIHRCLSTVPSRLCVPFNPAEFWSCYTFHNKVVTLYLRCLPKSQHALVLERLRYAMPNNTELGLRLLHQEWQDGNMEHLKFQVRMLSSHSPKCLAYWNIALAVEKELKQTSEVRRLYHQALTNLPLCAELWKDRLLAAAADGDGPPRLRRLLSRVQQVGVSLGLSERLTLVTEDQ